MHPSPLKWAQTQTGSGGKILTRSKSRKCFNNSFDNHSQGMKKCPSSLVQHTVQKKDIHDGLGSVMAPGIMGNLQLHARTTSTPHVDILGLWGDVFFIAEHDCSYRNSTGVKIKMWCVFMQRRQRYPWIDLLILTPTHPRLSSCWSCCTSNHQSPAEGISAVTHDVSSLK